MNNSYLPSPVVHNESTAAELHQEATATPPEGRPSQLHHPTPADSGALSSDPCDTQVLSQLPTKAFASEIEDEVAEGVWGYLIPLDDNFYGPLVLKKRDGNFSPAIGTKRNGSHAKGKKGGKSAKGSSQEANAGGYLIGRHHECGKSRPSILSF